LFLRKTDVCIASALYPSDIVHTLTRTPKLGKFPAHCQLILSVFLWDRGPGCFQVSAAQHI
uniref:Ovule protein n=1 Tax=Haemonchus placei TaxID=6290 RepID=A0A0N4XA18_HAEPC